MPDERDMDRDLRFLVRSALVVLRARHPSACADPDVVEPLVKACRAADRLALMGRDRSDGRRGMHIWHEPNDLKEAA